MNEFQELGTARASHNEIVETYYEILNVPCDASRSLIRESYIRLKNSYSGSASAFYSLMSEQEVQIMLARVEEAFRVLNDDLRRRSYDQQIGIGTTQADVGSQQNTWATSIAGSWMDFSNKQVAASENHSPSTELQNVKPSTDGFGEVIRNSPFADRSYAPTRAQSPSDEQKAVIEAIFNEEDLGKGETFAKIRQTRGVSLEEIQEHTKVCLQYLKAIEKNEFSALPQLVFVKGFLRSYFRHLGIDQQQLLVSAFAENFEKWQKEKDSPPPSSGTS